MDWQTFQNHCCSLDLETNENGEIFALGAIFKGNSLQRQAPFNSRKILAEFDEFAHEATFLLGHNLLEHDLPICRTISSQFKFQDKPVVDTLLLSPLAFPENPYHRLVKDYKLVRDSLNDPLADARLALTLFQDQWLALQQQAESGLLDFYYFAFSGNPKFTGLQQALLAMGAKPIDTPSDLFKQLTQDKVCTTALNDSDLINPSPGLAYSLAWLRVAGGNSVLPPWVRLRFDDVAPTLNRLRDIPCNNPACSYCNEMHNPVTWLAQYFGFAGFRPEPSATDGSSLQEQIVKAAMCGKPLFAILPTGGGKSLCFQLPALIRFQRRGVLTIVISPLQALMKDQVDNLRNKTGAPNTAALYGMLTAPERGEVLQGIQSGDIALLYVSPEQLRNVSFQKAIEFREIGCWVFDEAHCLSKWGHDFRPDYLYAARFIKEFALRQKAVLPPVQCFTATAKQDVKDEIVDYFKSELAQDLSVFEGGVKREKLHFEVQTVNGADKYPRINSLLSERLAPEIEGGSAIIYCSTRKNTEQIADYLQQQGWQVEAFHAGKDTAEKKHIQENFVTGTTRIITATNAFGMGIDKEDVRLVIHADIPGSIENYLQEAGRAGRDQKDAECVLLFDETDIETQFKLSASSQITQRDIAQILRGLRKTKKDQFGNVVLTTGELLMDDDVQTSFDNEDRAADTKVKMAVSWLERGGFIKRNENLTQVFQGRPLVKNRDEAKTKVEKLGMSQRQQERWLAILDALFNADSDEGFSADELAMHGSFSLDQNDKKNSDETASQRVIRTLYDMSKAGLIQKSLLLTAFVRYKVSNSSLTTLEKICAIERVMLKAMQELAPDAENGDWQILSLRHLNQTLLNDGFENSNPEILRLLLASLVKDGQGLAGKKGSLTIRHKGLDQYAVKLNRGWTALNATVNIRQSVAKVVLDGIMQRIPDDTKPSGDLLVEFSAEDLLAVLNQDLVTSSEVKDPLAAVERALNFLHEQKIITLQKGLAVFRSAMTIEVLPEAKGRKYNKGDFEPLSQHYSERIFQVHVINEYAKYGLEKISHALAFVVAYFSTDKTEFVKRYFSDRKDILERATSQQSFQRIVNDLQNPEQIALVAGSEHDNLLILAGPGSGKTRVVVHRCAYLLRVKRIPARGILVLCFNRNAVSQLRRRLLELVGDDAKGVTIQTYHGLALRLTGHAMTQQNANFENRYFADIIQEATALLRGEKPLLGIDEDETRERLLAGYRYILVDEYQDIDAEQYQLISAIAGRNQDEERKLAILAVGDDDQNIYQFRGANVGFIRQFKEDYQAKVHYLVENYRSSTHIITASNQLIQHNQDRMKQLHPIRINQGRKTLDAGGRWQKLDPVGKGRVQHLITDHETSQAQAVVDELLRLRQLDSQLDWSQCAVLASAWRLLDPVRTLLELNTIPISIILPADRQPPMFRIREIANLLNAIKQSPAPLSKASDWLRYLEDNHTSTNIWLNQLNAILQDWLDETNDAEMPKLQTLEFLYEILAEQRRERCLGLGVFLSTVHSVKGMEFAHLAILDGGWITPPSEEQRRLYYVAMTRAKETLCLMQRQDQRNPFLAEMSGDALLTRTAKPSIANHALGKQYVILSMKDLNLSYAGNFDASHSIHQHLARLDTDSKLIMTHHNGKVVLKDQDGVVVAILSKQGAQLWSAKINAITSVTVLAMIRRYRDDSEEEFQSRCRVPQWELPLVEVVFDDGDMNCHLSMKPVW